MMKIYIETLGCPKNFNDSDVAAGILEAAGHTMVRNPEESQLMMVNTCGFINDAKTESIEKIFELIGYKEADPEKILIVSGCLSKRYSLELYKEMPEVDLFLGVDEYEKLPEIIEEYQRDRLRAIKIQSCPVAFPETGKRKLKDNPYTATIKVAEGCNNKCAYCVIPSIRGSYRSRKPEDILKEARWLADKGCRELILIAQDLTGYGYDFDGKLHLPELLKELCTVEKLHWIRLMYCYEDKITDELIKVMAEEEKICHYIDIPIQHASDRVLKAMNRRSTGKSIRNTIERLRRAIPDIHIRTTLITGFPGEKKEDFDILYDFADEIRFERLGVFAYSREEGTPAGDMKQQVRSDVKERRKNQIMSRQVEISLEKNQEKIGKVLEVLVEEKDEEGAYIGRTQYDAPEIDNSVIFKSQREHKPGEFVKVLVQDAFDYDLAGIEEL